MMYIEHFVLLAGAYNLGFFIELAEYFIFFYFLCMYRNAKQKYFFIFRIVVNVYKRETAMNHTPVYAFGLGYPPKTKHNLFTIQNSKHNEKD